MDGSEHREIGDAATGGASVDLGDEAAGEHFWLGYGDVMALSGDYFLPEPARGIAAATLAADTLLRLARTPGGRAATPGTRDEIIAALEVMAADEGLADRRFEAGGRFAEVTLARRDRRGDVERRVRDRYLQLAATNDDHFVTPGGVTHARGPGARPFGSAILAYRHHHQLALELARRLGRRGGDQSRAMAREAAAQHFLTDACTAGHLRTPVAQIRRFWLARYPGFWEDLQRRVAADTAAALRELAWPVRTLPGRGLEARTVSAVMTRTSRYPHLSVGDFLARLLHDWDNRHGLTIDAGGVVFGDGHVHQGVTRTIALAAVRAGIDDVEAAFALGASGSLLSGPPLYRAVRAATGAPDGTFLAEARLPRPSATNPSQNWRAPDLETLWDRPIVGATGTTVGEALAEMMAPGGQLIRQLDRLGQGLVEADRLLAMPVVGARLAGAARRAYHEGFVEPLAEQPRRVILSVVHARASSAAARRGQQPELRAGDRAAGRARSADHAGPGSARPARGAAPPAPRGSAGRHDRAGADRRCRGLRS
jgi:hypothetical protein